MKDYFELNLEALKRKYPELYQKILNYAPEEIGEIITTETLPTFRFYKNNSYAYDPEDPVSHIKNTMPILKNENDLSQTICIFTGIGLGYTQKTAFEERTDIFRMILIEPSLDMFCIALKYSDLRNLIISDKVFLFAGDINWDSFFDVCAKKNIETDFLFSDYIPLFNWNPELYNNTKQMARNYAERAIAGLGVMTKFGELLFKNRIINLKLLRESSPVDVLKGAFKNRPAILVSAGPSLGQSFESLKKAVGKCIIISLDSAAAPLLNNGIKPDFITTLDYQDINSEKLSPDIIKEQDFYLVANITSSNLTPKRLKLKHLFFSFQDNDAQEWIRKGMGASYRMPAVGSVAMLSLSFAQMIEADPIILVGHDFALTSKDIDHVQGAVLAGGHYFTLDSIFIKGVDGNPVLSNNTFFEFKVNFEQILKSANRNYINSTAAGAHIEGTVVQSLDSVIETYLSDGDKQHSHGDYERSKADYEHSHGDYEHSQGDYERFKIDNVIAQCLAEFGTNNVKKFIDSAKDVIVDVKKHIIHINKILKETSKISNLLKDRTHKFVRAKEFSQLPSNIQSSKKKIKKLYDNYDPFLPMEELCAKKVMESNSINLSDKTLDDSIYINRVLKENINVEAIMQAHKYGLEEFLRLVIEIIVFLETEDKYINKLMQNRIKDNELIDFVEFYLESELPIKSQNILNKFMDIFPDSNFIPKAKMLMGAAAAKCLDFAAAFQFWEDAEKMDSNLKGEIIECRKNLAHYWAEFGGYAGFGIIKTRIKRALLFCSELECWKDVKYYVWGQMTIYIDKYLSKKNNDFAESFLLLCEPLKEKLPEWNYYMARILFYKNKLSEVLLLMEASLNSWNECVKKIGTHLSIKENELDLQKIEEAEFFKDMCQALKNGTAHQHYDIAKQLYDTKQLQELNIFINESMAKYSNSANLLALSARFNIESGNYDKGIEELIKAVELDPLQAVLWEELGDSLFLDQDYTSAAIAYEKCFIALPDKIDVLRKFGDCYLKNSHYEAAKEAYIAVLKKDPLNSIAKNNLMLIENMRL